MAKLIVFAALAVLGTVTAAYWSYRRAASDAESASASIASGATQPAGAFDTSMLADLPEVARRYFVHAIEPGTPLYTTVQLEMTGKFLLGDKDSYQAYEMTARQVLAPPSEFVWIPSMRSGPVHISGSDALVGGTSWTRFWVNGLLPVVNLKTSPDLTRSALTRAAMEGVWAPASLLPENGVVWKQIGPNTAKLSFTTGIEPVILTLDASGGVLEIRTMRWSDANRDRVFRLQSFGGTIETEATFGGFTIPSVLHIGNHFGTDDYLPFFQVQVILADHH